MRKQTIMIPIVSIIGFLLVAWLPSQAQDDLLYGCAKEKSGKLRIVATHSECLPSEHAVTLHGAAGNGFVGEVCWQRVGRDCELILQIIQHAYGRFYNINGIETCNGACPGTSLRLIHYVSGTGYRYTEGETDTLQIGVTYIYKEPQSVCDPNPELADYGKTGIINIANKTLTMYEEVENEHGVCEPGYESCIVEQSYNPIQCQ